MSEQLDQLPVDQILQGNCLEVLPTLPPESVDLIFADPPYNLQLQANLWRPNLTLVDGVDEAWDKFDTLAAYDEFTRAWLKACQRVLKPTGTLWVIGSYHNIYRVGKILQDLNYWILNDVIWVKANPMPNFRGMRYTNAHETLLWVQKERGARYTFNYHAMKELNEGLQMRSDWFIPICTGTERLKQNGKKVHPTQKPEALLYRVILASSNAGDVVLDPFFGTGTTGAVARKLHRHFIGIEIDPTYIQAARKRVDGILQLEFDPPVFVTPDPRHLERIPFGALVEQGFLEPGQALYFGVNGDVQAVVLADGNILCDNQRGSIHAIAHSLRQGSSNGWTLWYYWDETSQSRQPIDKLRQTYREESQQKNPT
jgi:modification methylase